MAAIAAMIVAVFRNSVARFEVVDNSMRPALAPGDYLVAVRTATPRRGDIVVFPDRTQPNRDLVKRVIGLAGETITVKAGDIDIDGEPFTEPWADGPTLPNGQWHNPPNTIFVLGDNRSLSSGDSRVAGSVRVDEMYRVVYRYWPVSSVGRL